MVVTIERIFSFRLRQLIFIERQQVKEFLQGFFKGQIRLSARSIFMPSSIKMATREIVH